MKRFLSSYGWDVAGLVGFASTVAGIWGLGGWPWAAIAGGIPVVAVYLWTEVRVSRRVG